MFNSKTELVLECKTGVLIKVLVVNKDGKQASMTDSGSEESIASHE